MCFGSQNLKKTSLERTRRRWDDNIKLDLKINMMGEFGLDSSTSGKGQWRDLVNMVMNLRVAYTAGNLSTR